MVLTCAKTLQQRPPTQAILVALGTYKGRPYLLGLHFLDLLQDLNRVLLRSSDLSNKIHFNETKMQELVLACNFWTAVAT